MRKIFLFLAGLSVFGSFAQKQDLAPEKANHYSFYPESLYFLQWVEGTNRFVYNNQWRELVLADASNPSQTQRIDLGATYGMNHTPAPTHIDGEWVVFPEGKSYHFYNYVKGEKGSTISLPEKAENITYNAQKKAFAYTLSNNLYIGKEGAEQTAVTNFTDANIVSGQSIHRSEFGISGGIFWSPKGTFLAFYQKNETNVTSYPLVDMNTTPATLNAIKYPMAGQPSEQARIGVYRVDTKQTIYLDIDTRDEHYLTNLSWSPDEKFLLVAEVNRAQNSYALNRYDATTGKKMNTLFVETNAKWVEPEKPAVFLPKSTIEFLWLSEADGFTNVYWYNTNGKLVKQLTKFKWVVTDILGFDVQGTHLFLQGTGDDPREKHTYKVHLKTGKAVAVTSEKGTHSTQLSHDGKFLLSEFSNLSTPNKTSVISVESGEKKLLLEAKNPLENYNIGQVEFVTLKADDNKTNLYAKMIKPHNFDPNKKYPVLLYVYGGPHAQLVTNSWLGGTDIWQMAMASYDQYIIFTLDNRGSANRGFAFESVIHRNLATYAVKDQLTAVDYLKKQPFIDSNRLSVYGWSFGGFLTSSLMLRHPNVFKTAVAGGAVTDWAYYEVMYGERYMDTPAENPEGYADTKISNYMKNLNGKLLFIHGYLDDVVLPQHTLQVLESAVQEHKLVDLFFYPNHKHNVMGKDRAHLIKTIHQYIIKNN